MAQEKRHSKRRSSKKTKRNQKDDSRVVLLTLASFLAILIVAVALFYTKQRMRESRDLRSGSPEITSEKPFKEYPQREERKQEDIQQLPKEPRKEYKVAIIIDDLGYNAEQAEEILEIDVPLTLSIFPLGPYSESIAEKAHAMGREVMLHLPMEPYKYPEKNPGNGGLLLNMKEEELLRKLEENIRSVPFIEGVNNHMGSRFTEDREKMDIVLKDIKQRDLFFVDSLTTNASVGYSMAKNMALRAAGRDIFLDNDQDVKLICNQIQKLVNVAVRHGSAVAIGHPYPSTIEALKQALPDLRAKGVEVVPVSELVN